MRLTYKRGKSGFKAGLIVALCLLLVLPAAALAQAAFTDVASHWAASTIANWSAKGLVSGYPDGTFKPDNPVTRAEFVTLANRAFGFSAQAEVGFTDVAPGDWFAAEVAKAKAAGYIAGYEDNTFRPQNAITRQEVAVILSRVKDLAAGSEGALSQFSDAAAIAGWSRGAVAALVEKGLVRGYPDGTFKPDNPITRAEAVVVLDRALKAEAVVYDKPGTYGPATGTQTIEGDVTVSAAGVTLQNLVVTGDLLLAEGIGEGDVTLKNVTVEGDTVIKGGGSQSVVLENCNLTRVIVSKENVRVIARGSTVADTVVINTAAAVVNEASAAAFENVIISAAVQVTLTGNMGNVEVTAPATVNLTSGTVQSLEIKAGAQDATVNLASGVTVNTLTVNAASKVTGTGKIITANINASGTTVQPKPETTNIASGVSASVGTGTTTGGGGGGGGRSYVTASTIAIKINGQWSSDIPVSGNTATIDLSGNPESVKIQGLKIIAPAGSTLTVTKVTSSVTGKINVSKEITLDSEIILVSDLLGSRNEEVLVGTLRRIFGASVTVSGTLACSGYNSSSVSLTIILSSQEIGQPLSYEWADVVISGSNITATVKADKKDLKLLDDIDIYGFIMKTFGQVPEKVGLEPDLRDGVSPQTPDQITQMIAGKIGKPWSDITLGDLAVAQLNVYFKVEGSPTIYCLQIR